MGKLIAIIIALASVLSFAKADTTKTPYSDCGGTSTLQSVEVVPCENPERCDLKRGTNVTINISFLASKEIQNLSAVVHGKVLGMPMPFNFPQENACENSGLVCPIAPAVVQNYSVQLPISTSYPRINVIVKWELVDEEGVDVVCVEIPARLVN